MRGFSIIELLCVLGILAILSSLTLPVGLGALATIRAGTDVEVALALTRHAQLQSMHAVCSMGDCENLPVHGISVGKDFTVFEERTDASASFSIPLVTYSNASAQRVTFASNGNPLSASIITFGQTPSAWDLDIPLTGMMGVSMAKH